MRPLKNSFLIILLAIFYVANANQQCNKVGPLDVFYDPSCAQGGPGCNAGGQNIFCRFCG